MLIIQNCALLNLEFNSSNRMQLLDDNRLLDKKIVSVMAYTATEDGNHTLPYSEWSLTNYEDILNSSLYLNLVNNKRKNKIHISEVMLTTEFANRVELFFNEKFDLSKSNVEVKGEPFTGTIPLYVFYKTRKLNKDIKYNASVTYTIHSNISNLEPETIKLSDFVGKELENKPIKKILVSGANELDNALGYIDIVGKEENRRIEMLPLRALQQHNTKNIYFDSINIDYEKSTLKNEGKTEKMFITFFF